MVIKFIVNCVNLTKSDAMAWVSWRCQAAAAARHLTLPTHQTPPALNCHHPGTTTQSPITKSTFQSIWSPWMHCTTYVLRSWHVVWCKVSRVFTPKLPPSRTSHHCHVPIDTDAATFRMPASMMLWGQLLLHSPWTTPWLRVGTTHLGCRIQIVTQCKILISVALLQLLVVLHHVVHPMSTPSSRWCPPPATCVYWDASTPYSLQNWTHAT